MKSPEEFAVEAGENDDLRGALQRAQRQLKQSKAKREETLEAAATAAKDAILALGPIAPVTAPKKDDRRKNAEVALWHMTDWQYGKKTPSYNREVATERVLKFVAKAQHITEIQRADHPVKDCMIVFGGDMLEGVSWQFPTQPFEIDSTLFEQHFGVARLMVDVVRKALSIYDRVTVVSEFGNHGRLGSKRDIIPHNDNLDRFAYEHARQVLEGHDRLTWKDGPEDIQRVEIGAYRALAIHGDEVGRGGFASPMTIAQHINRWRSGAYPWTFRDCYVGHFHTHMELSLADGLGAVYWTGSSESENRYARDTMASAAKPSQRLHFINPKEGAVTSQFKIWL